MEVWDVRKNLVVMSSSNKQFWCFAVMESTKLFVSLTGLRAVYLLAEMVNRLFGHRTGALFLSHAGNPPYGHTTVRGWVEAGWRMAGLAP